MLIFIIDLAIFISLGVILFLVAQILPRITEEDLGQYDLKTPWVLVYVERADKRFQLVSEKMLRRIRVMILKLDNRLSNKLQSIKRDDGRNGGLEFNFDTDTDDEDNK